MVAHGPEVDGGAALGCPVGADHLEGLKGRDQHFLLPREEGVALDWDPKAGPDVKEGVFPKVLGHTTLQGRGGKAPQPDSGLRPGRLEVQALHPSEHLVALGWTLAAAQQLQGFGQQEVEYFFIFLFSICIFSLIKYLFSSFAHFLNGFFNC